MPETDESNYSGRQTALLKQDEQELRDAQSSRVLTSNIHLTLHVQQVRWGNGGWRWLL